MKGPKGKAKVLSKKEFERLIKVTRAGNHAERNTALLYFSFFLGLRVKEMASLRLSDVYGGTGIKDIVRISATMSKGESQRDVYLGNKKIMESLSDYIGFRQANERQFFRIDAPLFLSQAGGKFTPNTLQQLFKRLFNEAGIEGASSHSGRRTFCTRLIEQGVDIKAVSVLMGHKSIQMTAQYVQDNPERLKRIAEALTL